MSINQPAYLPWLGYFDRIAASDLHVVLDHVQFEKNSNVNRNKIKTAQGWTWLTVPVVTSGKFGDLPIDSLQIHNSSNWAKKHWQTIEQNYSRAAYFPQYRDAFAAIYSRRWDQLFDLTGALTDNLLNAFDIKVPTLKSSAMNLSYTKSDLVLEICQMVNAKTYLSGPFGRDYLDSESFDAAGIHIAYQDYTHPIYQQCYPGFEPFMSAIDLLFVQGPDAGRLLRTTHTDFKAHGASTP